MPRTPRADLADDRGNDPVAEGVWIERRGRGAGATPAPRYTKRSGTSKEVPAENGRAATLGEKLRELRVQRGHTLVEVSRATAISKSFLSLVETGGSDITLSRLVRLIQFYGVHYSDLVPGPSPSDPRLVRANDGILVHSEAEGIEIRLLVPDGDRMLMPTLVTVQPGGHTFEASSYAGEEFIHILEGTLTLHLGDEDLVLEPGDTMSYGTTTPHAISNPGPAVTRFLTACTPPPF